MNKRAFDWGRIPAADPSEFVSFDTVDAAPTTPPRTLDELVEHRVADLTAYQDSAYAQRYRTLVGRARRAESEAMPEREAFAIEVATSAYRLMAFKDEYEVARLYSSADFRASLSSQFSSTKKCRCGSFLP